MPRPPLRHLGCDVKIVGRRADGRAVAACLDRFGVPTGCTREVLPHELRGTGWHIAEVKRLVAAAPLFGAGQPIPLPRDFPPKAKNAETEAPARPLLSAHYAALAQEAHEREDHHDIAESHPSG